jgi:hypothetical protein
MQFKIQPARELYECFNHFGRLARVLDDKILTAPVEMLPQYGWKMRLNGAAIRKKRANSVVSAKYPVGDKHAVK